MGFFSFFRLQLLLVFLMFFFYSAVNYVSYVCVLFITIWGLFNSVYFDDLHKLQTLYLEILLSIHRWELR